MSNTQPYIDVITKHAPDKLHKDWVLYMLKTIQDANQAGITHINPVWVMSDKSVTGMRLLSDTSPDWFNGKLPEPYGIAQGKQQAADNQAESLGK